MLLLKESRVALTCFVYSYSAKDFLCFFLKKKTYTTLKQTRKHFLITDYFENCLIRLKRRLNTAANAGRKIGGRKNCHYSYFDKTLREDLNFHEK